jgi:hypothetical protein
MDTDYVLCGLGPQVLYVVKMNVSLQRVKFICVLYWLCVVLSLFGSDTVMNYLPNSSFTYFEYRILCSPGKVRIVTA